MHININYYNKHLCIHVFLIKQTDEKPSPNIFLHVEVLDFFIILTGFLNLLNLLLGIWFMRGKKKKVCRFNEKIQLTKGTHTGSAMASLLHFHPLGGLCATAPRSRGTTALPSGAQAHPRDTAGSASTTVKGVK